MDVNSRQHNSVTYLLAGLLVAGAGRYPTCSASVVAYHQLQLLLS